MLLVSVFLTSTFCVIGINSQMNKLLKISLKLLSSIIWIAVIIACEPLFPTAENSAPEGHSVNMEGVYHKEGYEFPYLDHEIDDKRCSGFYCHQNDLSGGRAKFLTSDSIPTTVSPSCYQCHSRLWSDENKP